MRGRSAPRERMPRDSARSVRVRACACVCLSAQACVRARGVRVGPLTVNVLMDDVSNACATEAERHRDRASDASERGSEGARQGRSERDGSRGARTRDRCGGQAEGSRTPLVVQTRRRGVSCHGAVRACYHRLRAQDTDQEGERKGCGAQGEGARVRARGRGREGAASRESLQNGNCARAGRAQLTVKILVQAVSNACEGMRHNKSRSRQTRHACHHARVIERASGRASERCGRSAGRRVGAET
jgi:hypothetical protein